MLSQRLEYLANESTRLARSAGWSVIDVFQLTRAFVMDSVDGVHCEPKLTLCLVSDVPFSLTLCAPDLGTSPQEAIVDEWISKVQICNK